MYEELRSMSLQSVLSELGFNEWKRRKGGTEFYGACPIHSAKSNKTSFSFNQDGRFQCFSCKAGGRGAIDLVKLVKKCGFQEAVNFLSSIPSREHRDTVSPAKELQSEAKQVENGAYKSSYEKFKVKSDWLEKRGFTAETLDHYGVFQYDNPARKSIYSGSVMFPVRRFDGETVGYLSRNIGEITEGRPKYLFPKGVQKALEVFGAYQLSESRLRVGYLVESPLCVMKFHQLGLPAVSPYGWSISPQQVAILGQLAKGWVHLPDVDKRSESLTQVLSLLSQYCWVKCPQFPTDDPEQLSREQILALT